MSRRIFRIKALCITLTYLSLLIFGICLRLFTTHFELFKDLLPILVALPAAYLAGIYQQRSSFLQQLRSTWKLLLDAMQDSIQFTHLDNPTNIDYANVMKKLSFVIDDFRSVYMNLQTKTHWVGLYPFESLKVIQRIISDYHFAHHAGKSSHQYATTTRDIISSNWKNVRDIILREFDRPTPTYYDSPYV